MYKQGEIIIVPFPFSDLSMIKRRPVLVISNNKHNSLGDDVITCGITSNIRDKKSSIIIDNNSLEIGTIPKTSAIKVDKLFTIEKRTVIKKVAKIKEEFLEKVKEEFKRLV